MRLSAHSVLAPSAAHRWINCPGSVLHEAICPEARSRDAADEGTRLHEQAALYLVGRATLNDEEHYILKPYIKHAAEIMVCNNKVETRVDIKEVHESCFGTVDLHAWNRPNYLLDVSDLKCGFGVVEVVDNWQLDLYSAGLFELYGLRWDDERITVRQNIIQPRAFHPLGPVRTITKTAPQLRARIDEAKTAAAKVLSGDPTLKSGPWCQNCAGRLSCSAFSASVSDAIQYVRSYELPRALNPVEMAVELDLLYNCQDRIEKRIAVLEEHAAESIRRGEKMPLYTLEQGRSNLKWTHESFVGMLEKAHGVELTKREPITPTQAIQKKLIAENEITQYTTRPPGKTKLKRVSTITARQVFGQTVKDFEK